MEFFKNVFRFSGRHKKDYGVFAQIKRKTKKRHWL